jgi:hypothetical protein
MSNVYHRLINIKDNFLNEDDFLKLKDLITSQDFCWHIATINSPEYTDLIEDKSIRKKVEDSMCNEVDDYQLVHMFYHQEEPKSTYFPEYVKPIYERLDIKSLIRIKANLNPRTEKNIMAGYHQDTWTGTYTSVFYINTNNGYTQFMDGSTVKSVENRMITFPSHYFHSGVSCTDKKYRIVMNFNYFK